MKVIAILCSDLHLQAKAPVARSLEPDWFEAMARPCRQLKHLSDQHACPVLCAGDVFDRWNAPPEVINFAIKELPHMYAVPGQHDLPYHGYNAIERSAYWTLAQAGMITDVAAGCRMWVPHTNILLTPFPWGVPLETVDRGEFPADTIHVALIHRYVWKDGFGYPGAPDHAKLTAYRALIADYDVAVFGDNHKGFLLQRGRLSVLNCGGFMRRKVDEHDYQPHVGLLMEDGSVVRHALRCGEDIFSHTASPTPAEKSEVDMTEFINELAALGKTGVDFCDAVRRYVHANAVSGRIKQFVLDSIGT